MSHADDASLPAPPVTCYSVAGGKLVIYRGGLPVFELSKKEFPMLIERLARGMSE